MNKRKFGIVVVVILFFVGLGLGFNTIFKTYKENQIEIFNNAEKNITKDKSTSGEIIGDKENTDTKDDIAEAGKNIKQEEQSQDVINNTENKNQENKKDEADDTQKIEADNNKKSVEENNQTSTLEKPQNPENSQDVKKTTITMSIDCKTAIKSGVNDEAGFTHLPSNGVILGVSNIEIKDGDTVFDVLLKTVRDKGIHMEYTGSGSTIYIEGIQNLYEFDGGQNSGWMYSVNDIYPNYGAGGYKLKEGDVIKWSYTCDLGADLGAGV